MYLSYIKKNGKHIKSNKQLSFKHNAHSREKDKKLFNSCERDVQLL